MRLQNRGSVPQKVSHDKDPPLLNGAELVSWKGLFHPFLLSSWRMTMTIEIIDWVLGPIQAYFIILATSTKGRERLVKVDVC